MLSSAAGRSHNSSTTRSIGSGISMTIEFATCARCGKSYDRRTGRKPTFVDPYNRHEMTDELSTFLETEFKSIDYPLVTDLIDVSHPQTLKQQWQWINKTIAELGMGPYRPESIVTIPVRGTSPPLFGYELARTIRKAAGLSDEAPVDSVQSLSCPVLHKTFRVEDRNHLPGTGIKSLIGQISSGEIISAGPHPHPVESQRFLTSRGLFHAIASTRSSQRLVTEAYSWDQQASRAFAAELLVPQQAIKNRISRSVADQSLIETLASEYVVSTFVVERQLQNMRIAISDD
jgi:IrrE N-terminal-like domain